MPDPSVATRLVTAAPLAVGGILVLFNPLYDRLIERGAKEEFTGGRYLAKGAVHTPLYLIKQYTSWALDVVQAGPLVIGPFVGMIVAVGVGTIKDIIILIYCIFVVIGFAVFLMIAVVKHPVLYGQKKIGFSRHGTLFFGWTRVSLVAMVLYLGAATAAAILA